MRYWGISTLVIALVGCRSGGERPPVSAEKKEVVAAAPAERSFACQVVARETVAAGTALSGTVETVLVDVGAMVADGQVLAIIGRPAAALMNPRPWAGATVAARKEAEGLAFRVKQQRVLLTQAETLFRRQELLNREGATPRRVYEGARAERDRLAAELAAEEEASRMADNALARLEDQEREASARNLDAVAALASAANAEVHAPAAGLVVERNIAAGELVTDANRMALFRIAPQPELLRAEFDALPAGERISLRVGDVSVGAALAATVAESGKFADFESRMAAVRPGSPCTVTVRIK